MAIHRRLQVIVDLEEIVDYIAQHNTDAATRFLGAVEESFIFLERFPRAGRTCRFHDPSLFGVRKRGVHGFPRYVIYYQPIVDGVEIIRVLHGSRDRSQILGEEFN